MSEQEGTQEIAQKPERPGKAHHHVLIGVAAIVVAFAVLGLAWLYWGGYLQRWCTEDTGCSVEGSPDAPFTTAVPDSNTLPQTPDTFPPVPELE